MQIEGLVLQNIPFKDYDHIVTLFTPHSIFKLFVKGKKRLDPHHNALISPFTIAEYTYETAKSELHRFQEGRIVEQNLKLRDRLASFEAAQKILLALHQTQWPNKPAPALYLLTKHFLKQIPQTEHPDKLLAIYYLKLLKHEGILDTSLFTEEEQKHVRALSEVRSFEMLETILPDDTLAQKIEELFQNNCA
ncbi:MAG: DNA repair protein RecO [Chlamydiales bacterium]|nr:DNA repair protein RecO [Chlamydiales bacterium]